MRFKPRKLIFIVLIVFIIYVSYKIVEPDILGANFLELERAEFRKLKVNRRSNGVSQSKWNTSSQTKRTDVVKALTEKYILDFKYKLEESPWEVAEKWLSPNWVHPEYTPELGAVLHAMATRKIISADVGYKGTQLKMALVLDGGQKAVFKPKWFSRDHVIEGPPYAGEDRHNGEIAAFHLGRLLEFRRTPLAVGRVVNLEKEIKPVAKSQLLNTFFYRQNNTCFYGKCYYCKGEETGLCGEGPLMEGAIVLWLPESATLKLHKHPWSRTYRNNVQAQWETDNNYCINSVLKNPLYSQGPRLLDIIDTAVFDYLIGNADRHHYETLGVLDTSVMMILDNAKSFGNPYVDERSILAPLYQCCRIRESTWQRLKTLDDGILSDVLGSVLGRDPIAPVINTQHLRALDRRLQTILNTVKTCIAKYNIREVLIKER